MHAFMAAWNQELVESGEFVDARGLAAPVLTRRIQLESGVPVVTDGPYAETEEVLAGYTIVECDSFDRATEIAARVAHLSIPSRRARGFRGRCATDRRRGRRTRGLTEPMTDELIEDQLRILAPQVLGALVRRYGHFDTAEDAVQEALLAAVVQWPHDGVPREPRAWLITVASRRLTDLLRSEQARQRREGTVARWALPEAWTAPPLGTASPSESDDSLILLFMCCHPALPPGLPDRAHAAGCWRADHGRGRSRVPCPRSDDDPADQPGQAAHQGESHPVRDALRG